jgi:hypothetical protein
VTRTFASGSAYDINTGKAHWVVEPQSSASGAGW